MEGNRRLRELLLESLRLKRTARAGWLRRGVRDVESVAAHSWGVAWIAMALCPAGLDRARVLEIALVHDLPEVRTGDLTPHDGVGPAEKRRREAEALAGLTRGVPDGSRIAARWREYAAGATPEARFVRRCDKLDMALQAELYEAEQGIALEEFRRATLGAVTGADPRGELRDDDDGGA